MNRPFLIGLILGITAHVAGADDGVEPDASARRPQVARLKQVVQPKRLMRCNGVAFGRMELWSVIYHSPGEYATLDPTTDSWNLCNEEKHRSVIKKVAASLGGVCFADGDLWVTSESGDSIGCISTDDWRVKHHFKVKQKGNGASQSYAGVTFDGDHLWVAWHWFNYALPESKTQLLLKLDPATGKVVGNYPIPAGDPQDGAHGLTWDGTSLWHMKDQRLSSIDPTNGEVIAQYNLWRITRPTGLAWDGSALWIVEFSGALWRLPLDKPQTDRQQEL